MLRTLSALAIFVLAITGIWFLADSLFVTSTDPAVPNDGFTQLSGILSTAMMCFAILLAARPRFLEPVFNGLDKMYRLHKWLGIGALVTGLAHWLIKTGGGHEHRAPDAAAASQTLFETLRGPAHGVAEPAMFVLFAFIAVALITKIPYRFFAKTHYLIAIPFAVLAFHSVLLLKASYWTQPIGWLTLAMVAVGLLGTLYSLFGMIGAGRKSKATIESGHYYPEVRVLEATLKVDSEWKGHKPGQFAFVTTDKKEGPHPFTIATAWDAKTASIGFIAKELGDFTTDLRGKYKKGDVAIVEGPYGCFTFEDDKPSQIWIGAGVGIAPFVAHMRQLATTPSKKNLYLFHSTAEVSELALAKMKADAKAANVTLHILISPRDGRLDADKIKATVPEWKSSSIWFCGPSGFGASLKSDFMRSGLAYRDFHQELFRMR